MMRFTTTLLLFPLTTVCRVSALAPINPEWSDNYETVQQMRRRLNATFEYRPLHLNPEHCRNLSKERCQERDEIHGRQQAQNRRHLATGNMNILVLPMYFPEDRNILGQLASVEYLDELLNGVGTSDINPVGSVKAWMEYNSFGAFSPTFVVEDWAQTPQAESVYANGDSGASDNVLLASMISSRLQQLDRDGMDWSRFDSDNDRDIDAVVVITSGIPGEFGPIECAAPFEDRIRAQAVVGYVDGFWTSSSNPPYRLNSFTVSAGVDRPFCEGDDRLFSSPTKMAIIAHEFMHILGLPDLYDTDFEEPEQGFGGLGAFDIMAYTYGWTNDGARPGFLSAYSKMLIGWHTPIEIKEDGFYIIQPAEVSRQVYIISDPYPEGEYLLIESRYGLKWEDNQDGSGIAIYHVDENAPGQNERGYPGKSRWPQEHYAVALLQADGNYDIERLTSIGDAGDFWTEGMTLGADTGTWPNTASYSDGLVATGLSITITSNPSYIMQFEVRGFRALAAGTQSQFSAGLFHMGDNPAARVNIREGTRMNDAVFNELTHMRGSEGGGEVGSTSAVATFSCFVLAVSTSILAVFVLL